MGGQSSIRREEAITDGVRYSTTKLLDVVTNLHELVPQSVRIGVDTLFEPQSEAGDSVGREVEQPRELHGQQQRVEGVRDAKGERPEHHVIPRVLYTQKEHTVRIVH